MPKETVTIPDHQAEFIREMIASGRYEDINEVIRVSVHLLEERVAHEERQKEKLRAMLDAAFAGGVVDKTIEEILGDIDTRYLRDDA